MAIVDALIPQASADIVAIFPESAGIDVPDLGEFTLPGIGTVPNLDEIPGFIPLQVFANARPMRVQASEPLEFMVHPLSNGSNVTDHSIVRPVELSIVFILQPEDYRTTYFLMRQAARLRLRFSIQTKATTYTSMFISDLPHEEDPALFDTIRMVVQFREVQFFSAQVQELSSSEVTDAQDASTIDRGEQQGVIPSADQSNSGSRLFQLFGDLF